LVVTGASTYDRDTLSNSLKPYTPGIGTSKAIEHYEKFLNLWNDTDPGIAEVKDARERLARLKGENP
jgi:hypothetical protein